LSIRTTELIASLAGFADALAVRRVRCYLHVEMALPRGGFREIVVDGHAYLWRVRAAPYDECCQNSGVTVVDGSRQGSFVVLGTGPIRHRKHAPITPRMIAARIREALAQGWQPGHGHGCYTLPCAWDDDVLALVDRARL